MPWHYKSPLNFPASMLAAIRTAADNPNQSIILGGFTQQPKAKALAEKLRHLRWCVKQDVTISPELNLLFTKFDIRTSIVEDNLGFIIWIIAKPTKVRDFIEHNPKLADEVLSDIE